MRILICATLCITLALAEYPRFKLRAPPPPPSRSSLAYPPIHQKKWPIKSAQPPPRQRRPVIPVHMPPLQHKMQHHQRPMPPAPPPMRTFWKKQQQQTTFRPTVVEKKPYQRPQHVNPPPKLPEKTFLGSPSINGQEYDYHLHTNAIPNHIHTIKQVGEKGPIHTIPAPNLSLADRPQVVEEVKHHDTLSYVQIQKSHQYQVTEAPAEQQVKQKFYNQPQQLHTEVYLGGGGEVAQPKEIYQLVNAFPQQQPLLDALALPGGAQHHQSSFIQQFPAANNYQMLLAPNSQLFQTVQQQQQEAADKVSLQPEYQSFNYEEQGRDKGHRQDLASLVTSSYNLEQDAESSETIHTTLHRNNDAMAQSQYVQNYFDTREESANNVEPDAKPSQDTKNKQVEEQQQGNEESSFYVRLPNKQAADSLASLQAAGKINSNLMEMSKKNNQMTIYVPEVEEGESGARHGEEEHAKSEEEYDEDYGQEEGALADQVNIEFGHKLSAKRN